MKDTTGRNDVRGRTGPRLSRPSCLLHLARRGGALLLALGLSACFVQPPAPVLVRDVGGASPVRAEARPQNVTAAVATAAPAAARVAATVTVPAAAPASPASPAASAERRLRAPLPARALNVNMQCRFRDESGAHGSLSLEVAEDSVRRFAADVNMPRRGACRFDLAHFRQTEATPTAVLAAHDNPCQVLFWQQDERVTVAFSACEAQCSGDAFSYLWPILADAQTGACS